MSLVYFYKLVQLLEESPELQRTFYGIAKQLGAALVAGGAGGAVGGPLGCLMGVVAGGLYGYSVSDNYSSLVTVLKEMSDYEKRRLEQRVQELVGSSTIEALVAWVGSEVNRQVLMNTVGQHVKGG